jgi:hypothetical protein
MTDDVDNDFLERIRSLSPMLLLILLSLSLPPLSTLKVTTKEGYFPNMVRSFETITARVSCWKEGRGKSYTKEKM